MGGRSTVQYYGYSAIEGKAETENYEKDNLPVRYSISDEKYIDYTYDSLNRLTGKTLTLASPLSYSYVYKTSQRGSGYTTSLIGRENIGDSFYRYTYDGLGNITNILSGTLSDSDSQSSYRKYTYDALNQLVREDNKSSRETYIYVYDDYGNITEKRVYNRFLTEEVPADKFKEAITYSYGTDTDSGWKKLLKSYNGEAITYDAIGNPTTYRGATLDWNERQLKSYKISNDLTVTYKYDADGLRASKTVNGDKTTYQYVSGKLMYENRNGTDIYYYYDSNGTPVSIRYYEPDGTTYRFYLATNQLGDVIGLYNTSGNLVVKYEYDAWGNIIAETNATGGALNSLSQKWSDINPFRYRGYYYDSETGLYYLNSRYYDSETGRFINADGLVSTGQGLLGCNMFAYCGNNPVNRKDNTGMFWEKVGNFLEKVCNGVMTFFSSTFGFKSTVDYEAKSETELVPAPLNYVFTIKQGQRSTSTVSKSGDGNKPIVLYSQKRSDDILLSSGGYKVNLPNSSFGRNYSLENTGLSYSWNSQNVVKSLSITADLTQLKVGFEYSTSYVASWDSNTIITKYTNSSISLWAVWALACVVVYGELPSKIPVETPQVVYG